MSEHMRVKQTRTYGVRSIADAAKFFNDRLVELGWDECEACGGHGQIQTGMEALDFEPREYIEVYDTCPNCDGFGILPTRGHAAALVKEQMKTELHWEEDHVPGFKVVSIEKPSQ